MALEMATRRSENLSTLKQNNLQPTVVVFIISGNRDYAQHVIDAVQEVAPISL